MNEAETSEVDVMELMKRLLGVVVHLMRPIDEVVRFLENENARPDYGEPIEDVYRRREPWYKECSNFELSPAAKAIGDCREGGE